MLTPSPQSSFSYDQSPPFHLSLALTLALAFRPQPLTASPPRFQKSVDLASHRKANTTEQRRTPGPSRAAWVHRNPYPLRLLAANPSHPNWHPPQLSPTSSPLFSAPCSKGSYTHLLSPVALTFATQSYYLPILLDLTSRRHSHTQVPLRRRTVSYVQDSTVAETPRTQHAPPFQGSPHHLITYPTWPPCKIDTWEEITASRYQTRARSTKSDSRDKETVLRCKGYNPISLAHCILHLIYCLGKRLTQDNHCYPCTVRDLVVLQATGTSRPA